MIESAPPSMTINPFEVALKQLEEAAEVINLDKGIHQILANPKRVLTVSIPIRMDNKEIRVFTGFRSHIMIPVVLTKEASDIILRLRSMKLKPYLCG